MRIAIFTEVTEPYVSGISSYVDVLKKGLESEGHKVLIVTSSLHTEQAVVKRGVIRCPARKSVNKYGYECKDINDKHVYKFLQKFRPEVVHIQTDTKIGYMGLTMADRLRCPVVFTVHDYFLDRFAASKSVIVWKIKTFFEKRHFCDMIDNSQVITSSNKRASLFIRAAGRKRKVLLVPMATDQKRFDYRKSTPTAIKKMRTRFGIPENAVVAVFAGDLSVEKNLEFVLTAFAKHTRGRDNIHFLIVGGGTEAAYLKTHCAKLHVTDRVHFTGAVAHSIMPDIFSASDMYVCSSDDGLMSMSFVEAMACGLPVLVKEDQEKYVYNMVRDGVNGFIYKDEETFVKYLKTVSVFSDEKKSRMKKIVRHSQKNTTAEYMARCMIKAYQQAIAAFDADNEKIDQ